jgi:hypothetical protein
MIRRSTNRRLQALKHQNRPSTIAAGFRPTVDVEPEGNVNTFDHAYLSCHDGSAPPIALPDNRAYLGDRRQTRSETATKRGLSGNSNSGLGRQPNRRPGPGSRKAAGCRGLGRHPPRVVHPGRTRLTVTPPTCPVGSRDPSGATGYSYQSATASVPFFMAFLTWFGWFSAERGAAIRKRPGPSRRRNRPSVSGGFRARRRWPRPRSDSSANPARSAPG